MRESGPLILAFPGIAVRRTRRLCRWVVNPTVRRPEWRLVVAYATRGVDGNDREATARVVYDFVREIATYQPEPHEHIQAPTSRPTPTSAPHHSR